VRWGNGPSGRLSLSALGLTWARQLASILAALWFTQPLQGHNGVIKRHTFESMQEGVKPTVYCLPTLLEPHHVLK
jgi:hypothetical protein